MKYALGRVINVPNEMMNRIANNTAKGLDSDSIEPGDDSMDESPSNEEPRQHIVAGVVYQHVSNLEDGVLEESIEQHSSSGTFTWERFWFRTIFSDNQFTLARVKLLDGAPAVKLLKFYMLTLIGIVSWFYFVRWVGLENDTHLTLLDIWLYESNLILMDVLSFYLVGRLYNQRGVDHFGWILWVVLANIYSSVITLMPFLQHSFTLYEMHCTWPTALWLFVLMVAIFVIMIILSHVRLAVDSGLFFQKFIELTLAAILLVVPLTFSPFFHFHHWFAGWLIGMHSNFDVWWSRSVMAWCWGCYINGIAVYGRDPVLTCGYSYYLSTSLRCPYMKCYLEGIHKINNETNQTEVDPMLSPDWRNCSASTYHS